MFLFPHSISIQISIYHLVLLHLCNSLSFSKYCDERKKYTVDVCNSEWNEIWETTTLNMANSSNQATLIQIRLDFLTLKTCNDHTQFLNLYTISYKCVTLYFAFQNLSLKSEFDFKVPIITQTSLFRVKFQPQTFCMLQS